MTFTLPDIKDVSHMEILTPEQYPEYETFVSGHKSGRFQQSVLWRGVKDNWGFDAVVSRDSDGRIKGAMGVLSQRVPLINTCMLYAPRGPVCDLHDKETLADLKAGADVLAKKYNAYTFKIDPDILMADSAFLCTMEEMGFRQYAGPTGFETIQSRFNYRLYFEGRGEEALFMNLTQKTRYNIRVAQKHGVEVRVVGPEYLDEFMRLMTVTGERDGFNIRPKAYFARMLEVLGEHARLYMSFYQDKAVSGALCVNFAGKTCYVYGASDNEYRNVMPNYLIQWEMIRWAIETGCFLYDFQGVSGNLSETDHLYGLYRFKRGFNGVLEELAGEFDYIYRPVTAWFVNIAIHVNEFLGTLRRKLRRR